jgi:hypothetical protein
MSFPPARRFCPREKFFQKKVRAIPRAGKVAASQIAVETYAMYSHFISKRKFQ